MSTFMAKAETIERKWYVIDAAGKPVGKTAVACRQHFKRKAQTRIHSSCRLR